MPKALPQAVKILQGTHRPSRDAKNSLPATGLAPLDVPMMIINDDRAVQIYYQLIQHVTNMKIVSQEDDFVLALLASRISEIERCDQELEDNGGATYTTSTKDGDMMYRTHPASTRRSEAMRHAQSLLVECGLTPVARAKVGTKSTEPNNPFGVFG